jgi:uncharacterized membrane protein
MGGGVMPLLLPIFCCVTPIVIILSIVVIMVAVRLIRKYMPDVDRTGRKAWEWAKETLDQEGYG